MQTKQELEQRAKTHAWKGKKDCHDCDNGATLEARYKAGETGWIKCPECTRGYFVSEEVPLNPHPEILKEKRDFFKVPDVE